MDFCGLCGMARTAASPIHLCTAEVVGLLSRTDGASA